MIKNVFQRAGVILFCFTILIGMLPAYPKLAVAADIDIPIANSNFEESIHIPGWEVEKGNGTTSADRKLEGEKSLSLTSEEGSVDTKSVPFTVSEGEYQFLANIYLDNVNTVDFKYGMVFYDSEGKSLGDETIWTAPHEIGEWIKLQNEVHAPVGTVSAAFVFNGHSSSLLSAYIDDVKLVKKDDGNEVQIKNNSFESAVEIPGWLSTGSLVTVASYENSKRLRLHDYSDQIQAQVKSERIPVLSGKSIRRRLR